MNSTAKPNMTWDARFAISGKYLTGDFSYSINMSSYRNKRDIIEAIGEPLSSMYRAYESTGEKWQPVPDENCLCLKFRADDWEIIVPPGDRII